MIKRIKASALAIVQADSGCTNRFCQCVTSSYVSTVCWTVTVLPSLGRTTGFCATATLYTMNCLWECYAIHGCGS